MNRNGWTDAHKSHRSYNNIFRRGVIIFYFFIFFMYIIYVQFPSVFRPYRVFVIL